MDGNLDLRINLVASNDFGRRDAVHLPHLNVHQYKLIVIPLDFFNGFAAIYGLVNNGGGKRPKSPQGFRTI